MISRRSFSLIVAVINLYTLGAWIYAYNKYPIHLLRTTAFREFFGGLNLDIINLFVTALTIASLVFVFAMKQKSWRFSLLIIHLITLAFILWMNL